VVEEDENMPTTTTRKGRVSFATLKANVHMHCGFKNETVYRLLRKKLKTMVETLVSQHTMFVNSFAECFMQYT